MDQCVYSGKEVIDGFKVSKKIDWKFSWVKMAGKDQAKTAYLWSVGN